MDALFVNKELISKRMPSLSVSFLSLARCDWNFGQVVIKCLTISGMLHRPHNPDE